ncbi:MULTISPECIES: hypothetical protein [Clostridium]|uniref:hypothetical protein n=1 Tax=Clostridium TaxID=1485 RepID=UPI0007749704|nr:MULTISPECIES: hypothetical protein [Clostridium]AUM96155.1 hypothetical protein RSJ11_13745 [Clostridium sporogenes]AVQ53607.1 hypothetical protein C7M59_12360 [Clostridium botulinum]
MKIICDNCKREFVMKQEMLREKYLGAMYTETYYNCPKCGKKYLVCIMNSKCMKLKREIKENSLARFNTTKDIETVLLDKNIDKLQQELKNEMNRINGR